MTSVKTVKINKTSFHKAMSKSEMEKISKGTFKYVCRAYSEDTFNEHIARLEKAKSLFSKDEIEQTKSNYIFLTI